ncbi:MAG: helix-turn-helix domain-containing protein [Victivallaceae bacterium]|nr:helix-turn-helix domain-containing protein [Victivallaceae bacterium]
MLKVVDKTFKVLEAIVAASPQPLTPKHLAEALDLTVSTVSHILKMLLESGYILQISRQAGYVAGPKLTVLGNIANFEDKLLTAGKPLVDRIAENIQDAVLLSRVYGHLRYVLYLKNGNPAREIKVRHAGTRDLYATATGLVEMAYRPWNEQLSLYRACSANALLPDAANEESLQKLFVRIRKDGFYTTQKKEMGIFAVPVISNGVFSAALGCNIPASRYTAQHVKKVLKILIGAAAELSTALDVYAI